MEKYLDWGDKIRSLYSGIASAMVCVCQFIRITRDAQLYFNYQGSLQQQLQINDSGFIPNTGLSDEFEQGAWGLTSEIITALGLMYISVAELHCMIFHPAKSRPSLLNFMGESIGGQWRYGTIGGIQLIVASNILGGPIFYPSGIWQFAFVLLAAACLNIAWFFLTVLSKFPWEGWYLGRKAEEGFLPTAQYHGWRGTENNRRRQGSGQGRSRATSDVPSLAHNPQARLDTDADPFHAGQLAPTPEIPPEDPNHHNNIESDVPSTNREIDHDGEPASEEQHDDDNATINHEKLEAELQEMLGLTGDKNKNKEDQDHSNSKEDEPIVPTALNDTPRVGTPFVEGLVAEENAPAPEPSHEGSSPPAPEPILAPEQTEESHAESNANPEPSSEQQLNTEADIAHPAEQSDTAELPNIATLEEKESAEAPAEHEKLEDAPQMPPPVENEVTKDDTNKDKKEDANKDKGEDTSEDKGEDTNKEKEDDVGRPADTDPVQTEDNDNGDKGEENKHDTAQLEEIEYVGGAPPQTPLENAPPKLTDAHTSKSPVTVKEERILSPPLPPDPVNVIDLAPPPVSPVKSPFLAKSEHSPIKSPSSAMSPLAKSPSTKSPPAEVAPKKELESNIIPEPAGDPIAESSPAQVSNNQEPVIINTVAMPPHAIGESTFAPAPAPAVEPFLMPHIVSQDNYEVPMAALHSEAPVSLKPNSLSPNSTDSQSINTFSSPGAISPQPTFSQPLSSSPHDQKIHMPNPLHSRVPSFMRSHLPPSSPSPSLEPRKSHHRSSSSSTKSRHHHRHHHDKGSTEEDPQSPLSPLIPNDSERRRSRHISPSDEHRRHHHHHHRRSSYSKSKHHSKSATDQDDTETDSVRPSTPSKSTPSPEPKKQSTHKSRNSKSSSKRPPSTDSSSKAPSAGPSPYLVNNNQQPPVTVINNPLGQPAFPWHQQYNFIPQAGGQQGDGTNMGQPIIAQPMTMDGSKGKGTNVPQQFPNMPAGMPGVMPGMVNMAVPMPFGWLYNNPMANQFQQQYQPYPEIQHTSDNEDSDDADTDDSSKTVQKKKEDKNGSAKEAKESKAEDGDKDDDKDDDEETEGKPSLYWKPSSVLSEAPKKRKKKPNAPTPTTAYQYPQNPNSSQEQETGESHWPAKSPAKNRQSNYEQYILPTDTTSKKGDSQNSWHYPKQGVSKQSEELQDQPQEQTHQIQNWENQLPSNNSHPNTQSLDVPNFQNSPDLEKFQKPQKLILNDQTHSNKIQDVNPDTDLNEKSVKKILNKKLYYDTDETSKQRQSKKISKNISVDDAQIEQKLSVKRPIKRENSKGKSTTRQSVHFADSSQEGGTSNRRSILRKQVPKPDDDEGRDRNRKSDQVSSSAGYDQPDEPSEEDQKGKGKTRNSGRSRYQSEESIDDDVMYSKGNGKDKDKEREEETGRSTTTVASRNFAVEGIVDAVLMGTGLKRSVRDIVVAILSVNGVKKTVREAVLWKLAEVDSQFILPLEQQQIDTIIAVGPSAADEDEGDLDMLWKVVKKTLRGTWSNGMREIVLAIAAQNTVSRKTRRAALMKLAGLETSNFPLSLSAEDCKILLYTAEE